MSVLSLRPVDPELSRVVPIDRSIAQARERSLRYRVAVIACDTSELVNSAGGWIFDRSLAGWDVTVLAADPADPLPLRILGAEVVDLNEAIARGPADVEPQAYAISAAYCATNARLRRWVVRAIARGRHEITLYGADCPDELAGRTAPDRHRLSLAARMFKTHALAAAGDCGGNIADIESIRTAGRLWPGTADPVPPKRR
ncbi:hypothetical protein [Nocardia sp. BMG111209]|uniref:hypothetical protein n=1 Tax=Nocardia sp. BMG111209 TaxID=1160137 RepID=UPI00037CA290|nr:hypothetical protein [Nocardia sp. BMG111209]